MKNRFGSEPKVLDFGEAITTCLQKYFVFEGRAKRSEFWPYFFLYTIGGLILDVSAEATKSPAIGIVTFIFVFGGMIPSISAACRRMHDIDKSGWFQVIPIYNLILLAQDSAEVSNGGSSRSSRSFSRSNFKSDKKDLTDELEELQELYEDGTLSEAQFKKAKKKLLK